MLFKYSNDSFPIDPLYKKTASQFSFKELNDLIYIAEPLENEFKNLERKIDNRIYPDLIAAIYRKMYEGSLVLRGTFANALLACSYHLQNSKYKFIAFMRGDEELRKDVPDIDFVKSWNFKKNFYNLADQSPSYISKTKIHEIFQQEDFNNAYNLFFIAGCQSFEMLDMRIKKAVNAISQLLNSKIISIDDVHVLLSGWNNSKAANSKIQFANESLVMQNLLILKFTNQLGKELPNDFVNNQIGVDVSSGNTVENVTELIKYIHHLMPEINGRFKRFNLFIVSSTFHLVQLADAFKNKYVKLQQDMKNSGMDLNVFLAGAENPDHFFKSYDSAYIKYLMAEVIYNGFQFPQ